MMKLETTRRTTLQRSLDPNLGYEVKFENLVVRRDKLDGALGSLATDRNMLVRGYWRRGKTFATLRTIYKLAESDKVDCFYYSNSHTGMRTDEILKLKINSNCTVDREFIPDFDSYRPLEVIQDFIDPRRKTVLAIDEFIFYHHFNREGTIKSPPMEIIDGLLRNVNLQLILVCHNALGFEQEVVDQLIQRPAFVPIVMGNISDSDFEKLLQTRAQVADLIFSDVSLDIIKNLAGRMLWETLTVTHAFVSQQKAPLEIENGKIKINDIDENNIMGAKSAISDNCRKIWNEALTNGEKRLIKKIVAGNFNDENDLASESAIAKLEEFGLLIKDSQGKWKINGELARKFFESVKEN